MRIKLSQLRRIIKEEVEFALVETITPARGLEGSVRLALPPETPPVVVRQLANKLSDLSRRGLTHSDALSLMMKDKDFPVVAGLDKAETAEHLVGMLNLPERRPVRY